MPSVEEVKLHVASSMDEVDHAILGMRGVIERLDEALNRLRLITTGSVHPRAAEALMRFEEARQKLTEAQTLALGGVDAAQAYRSIL
jgi:hypothetical protein